MRLSRMGFGWAERHEERHALVAKAPCSIWHYRQWGVKALAAMGRKGMLSAMPRRAAA